MTHQIILVAFSCFVYIPAARRKELFGGVPTRNVELLQFGVLLAFLDEELYKLLVFAKKII